MKKALLLGMVLLLAVSVSLAYAARGKMDLKVGDEVYACNCGESCCDELSKHAGKCVCGKEMVKAQVTKVEKGTATLKAEGWDKERVFKTVGIYACACPPSCNCDTISQKPGNCPCGTKMKKI